MKRRHIAILMTVLIAVLARSVESIRKRRSTRALINKKIAPRRSFTSAAFVQDDSKKAPLLSS